MTSNDDRQTKTQRQLTPTHILERAIDQLPPDERGRAREALEKLEGRINEVERLRSEKRQMQADHSRERQHLRGEIADRENDIAALEVGLSQLAEASDAVVEAAQALLAVDDPVDIIRKSQGLRQAIEQYQEVRESTDDE